MNNNLNSIESAFLAQDNINSALCLTEIKSGLTKKQNAQKRKFEISIALSKHVLTAYEWINSEDGKSAMAEQGLAWTMRDFSFKVFGWGAGTSTSYMSKMIKVGRMTEMFTDAFKRRAKIDINFTTSVASIIKFADVVDLSEMVNGETETEIDTEVALQLERAAEEAEASESETESETDSETESETETDSESDTIAMINIASIVGSEAIVCRIDRSINVHSHNSKDDVLSALDRLKSMVEQYML